MRIPHYLYPIAVTACLLSLLLSACSRDETASSSSADEAASLKQNEASARPKAGDTAKTAAAPAEASASTDPIVQRELPIDDINAEIQAAADNKAAWSRDVDETVRRFWQKQVADPYADSESRAEPLLERLPTTVPDTGEVGIRLMEHNGDGDDSINREWIDIWLHRDTDSGTWRIQQAIHSSECARGISGDSCL